MPDILNLDERKSIISEINMEENKQRKAESLRRFEVYKDRMGSWLYKKMLKEFGAESAPKMRMLSSVNICPKIINELSSIYNKEPKREWLNASENEIQQLDELYHMAKADSKLRKTNRAYNLSQAILQVLPKNGIIDVRCYYPHQIDAIIDYEDPEKAVGFVINIMDKSDYMLSYSQDQVNQKIADQDDYREQNKRLIWWSDEYNFVTDGNGNILSEDVVNPLGVLPFIDVSNILEKDYEFWLRNGSSEVDFAIDLAVALSDLSQIIKMQGFSPAVLTGDADSLPENINIGPLTVVILPTNSTTTVQPDLKYVSPNADIQSAINFIEMKLNLYLTSKGIDTKTVTGKAEASSYTSGLDRLLSMIDKFEASRQDFDVFTYVEHKLFELMKAWSNLYQSTDFLVPELRGGNIGDAVKLSVEFSKPEMITTQSETEDSVIKRLDKNLISKLEAIMELRKISLEDAELVLLEIDKQQTLNNTKIMDQLNGAQDEAEDQS